MTESEAHQHFSIHCFNNTWTLLDKPDRTKQDDRLMREMAHASLFHWLQREDCEPTNLSVGLWLVSRVYATLGKGEKAMESAQECIEVSESENLPPFYLGYGYEAAARSASKQGDKETFSFFLKNAEAALANVTDPEEKSMLEADLNGLREK